MSWKHWAKNLAIGGLGAALIWISLDLFQRHNLQHQVVEQEIIPIIRVLWQDCVNRGKCQVNQVK